MDEQGNILCEHSCGSPEIASTLDTLVQHGLRDSAANADIHVLEVSHQSDEMKKDEGLIQDGNVAR
jgi:hypothetical protein